MNTKAFLSSLFWLSFVLVSSLPSPWAQLTPLGDEFQVNTYTTGGQARPAIGPDPSGGIVIAWEDGAQDGGSSGIFAQRFDADGNPLGAEFLVNTYTTSYQRFPTIGADPSGGFVVVWQSSGQDGDSLGIFGQRFGSDGQQLGAEFQLNSHTTSLQNIPAITRDPSGGFVVVWQNFGLSNYPGLSGRRFDSDANPIGDDFQISSSITGYMRSPSIGRDPSGGFVVVWHSSEEDGNPFAYGVFGQRFGSGGQPLGTEFQINSYTSNTQSFGDVTQDPSGGFVVVWMSLVQDGNDWGVFGQRFGSDGNLLGGEFQVNSYTTSFQRNPRIEPDPSGGFVVAWESNQDGHLGGIFGQRFGSDGNPLGQEFQVNSYTTYYQQNVSISPVNPQTFVVAWDGQLFDGSSSGVAAQRFGPPPTNGPSPTPTETATPSVTPTETSTPTMTLTATEVATGQPTSTATESGQPSPTTTGTPGETSTPTSTGTTPPTETATPTSVFAQVPAHGNGSSWVVLLLLLPLGLLRVWRFRRA